MDKTMIYHTMSGKDIQWKTSLIDKPIKTNNLDFFIPINQAKFLNMIRKNNNLITFEKYLGTYLNGSRSIYLNNEIKKENLNMEIF
jgi:hypothetical protein